MEQIIPGTQNNHKINVIMSDDGMAGYIMLEKSETVEGAPDEELHVTVEQLKQILADNRVVYGIKENSLQLIAVRPIYGIKVEVARGTDPIDGKDGYVNFFVKRDSEYKPEYNEDGVIDYKNIEYFQQVTKGQLLCEVIRETKGTDGVNILGVAVPAKRGRPPVSPMGKNTLFNEDGTRLFAACSGVVRFIKDHIDINEVLQIRSSVDQGTGNINFPGDVIIEGDVCYGFSVVTGGSVTIRGVVEGASVEAAGDIFISKGINGAGGKKVVAGGNLRSGYIENAELEIAGDITTDYIIDSNIICNGNIQLMGKNELIVGGSVNVLGELTARYIGNEKERPTRIEVMGVVIADTEAINKLKQEREDYNSRALKLTEMLNQFSGMSGLIRESAVNEQLNILKQQLTLLKEGIDSISRKIEELENQGRVEYPGAVICKKKLYQGVKIYFGNELFRFDLDDIEHCRIFWSDGEIIHGTL
ncbi:MAG: DUF342 domain-containing protein [Clostridiales bacterium]|nr:DUF342 domain-containing protein [Clostridiales bacterium]